MAKSTNHFNTNKKSGLLKMSSATLYSIAFYGKKQKYKKEEKRIPFYGSIFGFQKVPNLILILCVFHFFIVMVPRECSHAGE